ncbi:MAG: YifB family Mg chelatase-like AAA ATPase [Parachlamydiaceae bacterium]
MSLSRIHSVALVGLDAVPVEVEVDVHDSDKTIFVIVGLPDNAVRESKDRVLTAIKNSKFSAFNIVCTVNLAPGDLRKEGALYDLPIAMGLLRSLGVFDTETHRDYIIVGELGLSGELRPIHGALAGAMLAKETGKKGILLPAVNAEEAAVLPGIAVIPIRNLREAVEFFKNPNSIKPISKSVTNDLFSHAVPTVDFADVKGQAHVKRAMEIAAAGNHNVVLSGPPGSGKTMLAKALGGIMPELTVEEALEVTKIHSIGGLLKEGESLVTHRPFRSPHHTVSYAGLIGGGTFPRPGEVSLAHRGILFLDELPEFSRSVLEVLRQPLEDRQVTISRARGNFTFPSDFVCVAAMNPCPCGYLGHPDKPCKDSPAQVDRYRSKISGPLWDRIDMHVEVPALRYADMRQTTSAESSATIRARVKAVRDKQHRRFGLCQTNSQMSPRELKEHCALTADCHEIIRQAIDVVGMSARACDRLLRVALTIADMGGAPCIAREHLMEAIAYRQF